jgi:hypothetical protein
MALFMQSLTRIAPTSSSLLPACSNALRHFATEAASAAESAKSAVANTYGKKTESVRRRNMDPEKAKRREEQLMDLGLNVPGGVTEIYHENPKKKSATAPPRSSYAVPFVQGSLDF